MFTKWFEKKAQKLGYIKRDDLNKTASAILSQHSISESLKSRISKLEKQPTLNLREIEDIALENNKRIKKLEALFGAVDKIRGRIENLEDLREFQDEISSTVSDLKEKQNVLDKRLLEIKKANGNIEKIEAAYSSFKNLEKLEDEIQDLYSRESINVNKQNLTTTALKKQIKNLEDKFIRVRINGHPLKTNTTLTIKDFDISPINKVETRVQKRLENFETKMTNSIDEKLIPHIEKEQKLTELNKKVDDIVRVNSNVKTLRKQKSFNELYRKVVEDSKKKI